MVAAAMNQDYEAFCLADPTFYDAPTRGLDDDTYALARRAAPAGWRRREDSEWVIYSPLQIDLPLQGWKVHVSGCLHNAERIVETAWSYCVSRRLAFKFLRGPRVVLSRNSKYAGRGGSGKLVTVYPRDEAELEVVCKDMAAELDGEPGPYILSDLRWGPGPVHVRYGGFEPRWCLDERGQTVLAIENATGELVPDQRGPVFAIPSWVTPPAFLALHLEARNAVTVTDIPYDIEEALHFSNGGGVYRGVDRRSGERVVLKEARPHAGLSGDGADAVARLRREAETLRRLDGIDAVPRLLDTFTLGEHEFLVMEHVDGEPLNRLVVQRTPLLDNRAGDAERADYARWARSIHDRVAEAIGEIHRRGLVYGDLHMFNVLVRPDQTLSLVDFEVAQDVEAFTRPGLGAVGFVAPRDRQGFDIDRYALACLKLALFMPLEALLGLDRDKAVELADAIAELFMVPRAWLDDPVEVITGRPLPSRRRPAPTARGPGADLRRPWPELRASVATAILASATPGRDDRLYPGDIAQFREGGGLNMAHGAAGVLYALHATGAERSPEHEDWLLRHAAEPEDGTRLGFWDGLHGVAHVLARLGHREAALAALDMCLRERWESYADDLYSGVAGIGLNLGHLADVLDEPHLAEMAIRAAGVVVDRLGGVDDVPETSGGTNPYAGLMRGSSGKALFLIRMYERTGDTGYLDHAATALRQDLRRCVRRADGEMQVDEGWRTMPYLARGSVGIGLVLRRYLAHRHDEQFVDALAAIHSAARAVFYVQSGLFAGRAGMMIYLADGRADDDAGEPELDHQIRRLAWHAIRYRRGIAFPGEQLLRLSMDLATGSAGVLLALGTALHDRPVHLPFLQPAPEWGVHRRAGPMSDENPERR